jgi:hypothetical protein
VGTAALLLLAAGPLAAQRTAVVVPGPEYEAGSLHEFLLGRDYRPLWTTPVRVEVLDLGTFAGGITPTETGGGNQTKSLRFRGADGREYAFRSVAKNPARALPRDLRGTVVEWGIRDQISSLVPEAGPITSDLQDALGTLHAPVRLYVMPDDPRLGKFRAEFAGMLGGMEERPHDDGPGFAGAKKIESTEDFLEKLEEDPENRVDARDWLATRLFDLWINDWDRHEDQYRWARYDRGGLRVWRPIPRDRDYAFVNYDGALLRLLGGSNAKIVPFGGGYPDLVGLVINAQFLDRRLLAGLPRPVWDSVALAVQGRMTDGVIEDALRRLSPEHYALYGTEIAAKLRARRAALPAEAERFYRMLAREPEIHATDKPERAVIRRLPGGAVDVAIYQTHDGAPEATPYFYRRFSPVETKEVRVFLHGGNDQAVVEGTSPPAGILVRVIGGGGDDRLEDRGRGARTAFYDNRGENLFLRGETTVVDERDYAGPSWERGGLTTPPRDWGRSTSAFRPIVEWRSNVGVVVGGGPASKEYGFRRYPWASSQHLRALWAPAHTRFGVEYLGEWRRTGTDDLWRVDARATELEPTLFHGFGNDTGRRLDEDAYRVWEREVVLEPALDLALTPRVRLAFGPALRYVAPRPEAGSPADIERPNGSDDYFQGGARARAFLDRRDSVPWPRRGFRVEAGGAAYPLVGGDAGAFGEAHAEARGYVPVPLPLETTLALRAGGKRVWGEFPLQEAAFVGGAGTVRGFNYQRFAGDASLFGSAEARVKLARANLLVRGDLGVLGLADAGRVWFDGDSPGGWHTAVGGGVWFSFLDRKHTVTAAYAHGERSMLYFRMGLPF